MAEPQRIPLRRTKGWRMPERARKVDRSTRWGNPFRVDSGTTYGPEWFAVREVWGRPLKLDEYAIYTSHSNPADAIVQSVDQFRRLLAVRRRDEPSRLDAWLAPLVGYDLACWCPLDQPCHADVLLEFANGGTR